MQTVLSMLLSVLVLFTSMTAAVPGAGAAAGTPGPVVTAAPVTPVPVPTPPPKVYAPRGSVAPPEAGTYVWRANRTTEVYHSYAACSNMKSPYDMTIEAALALELRPCSKCWKVK